MGVKHGLRQVYAEERGVPACSSQFEESSVLCEDNPKLIAENVQHFRQVANNFFFFFFCFVLKYFFLVSILKR